MKKILLLTLLVNASLFANTYLGGAYHLNHCSQLAGSYGYRYAIFGPGYDDRGVYYPYWNACFGSQYSTSYPPPSQGGSYYVQIRSGFNLNACATDIEWEVRGARCRVNGYNLQCKTPNEQKYEIERVRCVERAFPYLMDN